MKKQILLVVFLLSIFFAISFAFQVEIVNAQTRGPVFDRHYSDTFKDCEEAGADCAIIPAI